MNSFFSVFSVLMLSLLLVACSSVKNINSKTTEKEEVSITVEKTGKNKSNASENEVKGAGSVTSTGTGSQTSGSGGSQDGAPPSAITQPGQDVTLRK